MAEVAGLALGAATIPTLFSACLELAEQIIDARNVVSDYEEAYTKQMLLSIRLRKCGAKRIILEKLQPTPGSDYYSEWDAANRALCHIQGLLKKTNDLHIRYGNKGDNGPSTQSPSLGETTITLHKASERRQRTLPLHRKMSWAVHDKKAFDQFLKDFEFYVQQLEKLSDARYGDLPHTPRAAENMALCAPSQVAPTERASEDPHEARRLLQVVGNQGHTYDKNIVSGRARVRQGDVGHIAQFGARSHAYIGNSITGDARVLQGNTSGTDMSSFWND